MNPGMKALRDEMALVIADWKRDISLRKASEYADALLAPDGPLHPALRALGQYVKHDARLAGSAHPWAWAMDSLTHGMSIPEATARACLAAAEDPS